MPRHRVATPERLSSRLVHWFEEHQRPLPWRRTRDPYAIWVSEVMLQQTQVSTVLDYYRRWMQRFPSVSALATASEDDVLHAWQGLGYYSRARRLREGARVVLDRHGGRVPSDVDELRRIPGVGRYTAGAISSIAFGRSTAVVDGNVTRVLSRLHGLRGDPQKAPLTKQLWALAGQLLVSGSPGQVNQATMELGATVCLPRAPKCNECPLAFACAARKKGAPEDYPGAQKRGKPTPVEMAGVVMRRQARVLLVKLDESAPRWAGMWQFPNVETRDTETAKAAARRAARELSGLRLATAEELCVVKHSVTRFRITLSMFEAVPLSGRARAPTGSELCWRRPEELADLALPAAQRKVANRLL